MKKPTGSTGVCGDCIHTCIAIKKLIMDKTHVGMMGMSSQDSNDESSDDMVHEDKNVEENTAVEENMAYKDKNVGENAVSLLVPTV
jgi:hypothetical protein